VHQVRSLPIDIGEGARRRIEPPFVQLRQPAGGPEHQVLLVRQAPAGVQQQVLGWEWFHVGPSCTPNVSDRQRFP
jgi:hypothetical protein